MRHDVERRLVWSLTWLVLLAVLAWERNVGAERKAPVLYGQTVEYVRMPAVLAASEEAREMERCAVPAPEPTSTPQACDDKVCRRVKAWLLPPKKEAP